MTTLSLLELTQDGSPPSTWTQLDDGSNTSPLGQWHPRRDPGAINGFAQTIENFFPTRDSLDAEADLQAEFEELACKWKRETAYLSSLTTIAQHHAYQEIIGMGKAAIPMILRDLEVSHAQWFWALRAITRESPVSPDDRGNVQAMTVAWIEWGKNRRYI